MQGFQAAVIARLGSPPTDTDDIRQLVGSRLGAQWQAEDNEWMQSTLLGSCPDPWTTDHERMIRDFFPVD
jgi:hypothetical protein